MTVPETENNINDKASFELAFRKHYPALVIYAKKIIAEEQAAEDIVQEVFFTLWKKRKTVVIDTSLASYLFSAVRYGCMNNRRHLKVVRKHEDLSVKDSGIEKTDAHDQMIFLETHEIISSVIASFPPQTQKIFEMSRFERKKYREIAKILDISIKTVEAHIAKVLKELRKKMKGRMVETIGVMGLFSACL